MIGGTVKPPAMTNEELLKRLRERLLEGLDKPEHIKAAKDMVETLAEFLEIELCRDCAAPISEADIEAGLSPECMLDDNVPGEPHTGDGHWCPECVEHMEVDHLAYLSEEQ